MGALIGTGLYQYFKENKKENGVEYEIPKDIDVLVPFSFRQPIKDIHDVKLENDFCAAGTKIVTRENFDEGLKE